MEDGFDGDGCSEKYTMQNDWRNISERRIKDGYREGVTFAQEAALQDGFNKGFQEQLNSSLSHGYMSGVLSGLLTMHEMYGRPNISELDLMTMRDLQERLQPSKANTSAGQGNSTPEEEGTSDEPRDDSISKLNKLSENEKAVSGTQVETEGHQDGRSSSIHRQEVNDVDVIRNDFTELLEKLNLTALINCQQTDS